MGKGKSKNRRKVQESPSNNDSPSSAWLRESASSASSLDFEQDNIFGSAAAPSPPHNGNNIMNNEEDRYELLSSKYLALEREMQELKSLLHNSSSSLSFQQEQHHQRQHEGHIQSRAIGDFKGVMQYTFDENKNDNNAKKMDFSGTTTAHETFYDEEYSDLHQKDDTNSHHGNNGDEDEEEMAVGRLNPDSNAFLISAPLFSTPFIMAFLITCGKGIIFCLIAVSLASFGTQRNPLGIPAAIEATVAIGQLFALIITVCTQDDLITALMLLIDGYDQQSMLEAFPGGAYFYKWMLTAASMIGEGIFGMLVTFLLIITASDNVSLLLNFTAVEFVSLLDNVGFSLASQGLLGERNLQESRLVEETTYPVPRRSKGHKAKTKPMLFLFASFVLMLFAWGFVYTLQLTGYFVPSTIEVQFDDSVRSELGTYSGAFRSNSNSNIDFLGYRKARYFNDRTKAQFGYCRKLLCWTFRYTPGDPCQDIIARSSKTRSSDIVDSAEAQWYVSSSTTTTTTASANTKGALPRFFPLVKFQMSRGCEYDSECGGHGFCRRNECICDEGYYGSSCYFVEDSTCRTIKVESSSGVGKFHGGTRNFATEYQLLRQKKQAVDDAELVNVYDHPVYFAYSFNQTNLARFDVILYTGLRWVLLFSGDGLNGTDPRTEQELADYFSNPDFTAVSHLTKIEFTSETVLGDTPLNTPSPVGLEWKVVSFNTNMNDIEIGAQSNAALLCAVCNNSTNPCLNDNTCSMDNVCRCENGAIGTLCQISPLGNGICDIAFNLPNYEYDGGDCCLATCISSEDHSCGVIAVGQLENVNVGFPNCKDPENSCDGGACWAPSSRAIDLLFPGSKAHVTLSANGLALVVAEPDLDVVRLFDRTDSYWTQRGPVVQGVRNTDFGKIFAISTLPGEVVGIRFGRLPLIIAVGMHHYSIDGDNNSRVNAASVRVARWGANAIDWDFLGEDVKVCTSETNATCEIQSLHVVQVLKEVLMPVLLSNGDMYVYRTVLTENGINLWGVIGTIRGLNASVATITGDGKRMALDSNVGGRVEIHIFDLETQERGGNWTSAFHLKSLYPNEAAELGYTFEQFYNEHSESGIIEGEPTKIVAMSFLGDNSNLKVVAKGSGENDFLLRLQITGQSVLFTLEFNFALPEEDRSNYLPPVRFSEKALVSKAYQERDETASGRQIIQVFREGYTADGFLREYGEPFYSQEYIVDQSISFDGTTLATATADRVQVYGNIPTCGVNETLYRILITLDEFPSAISWSLESYQELGDDTLPLTVIATGDGRYSDNDRFSRGSVEEEVCIPKSETSCILLRFKSDVGLARGAGLVVLEGGQHISKYEGRGVKEEVVLRLSESEKCRIPKKQCDGGSSALVASVSFDKFPADLQWSLSNSRDEKLLFVENYDLRVGSTELFDNHFPDGDLAYSTVIHQACIPQDCYSLVVNDLYGDGFCCQYGKGEISMFVDNVLVSHFKGNEVSHFRRDIFGASCSEKDYVTVTFEIQMDAFPGDISYQIVEVNDREGNPSFRPVHVVSDTFHFFVQPHFYKVETIKVSRDATYELSISDFTGNGFPGGYYAVYFGDKVDREKTLVLRTGSFLKNQTDPFVASDASIIKADFDAVLSSPQGDVAAGSISGGSQGDNPSDQSVESGPENGIASDDVDDSLQGSDPIDQSIESDRIQIFNFTDLPNMTSTDESLSGIKTHENYTDNLFNN